MTPEQDRKAEIEGAIRDIRIRRNLNRIVQVPYETEMLHVSSDDYCPACGATKNQRCLDDYGNQPPPGWLHLSRIP